MKTVTSLELRKSVGKVISLLKRSGEPLILLKGKRPVAAIISLEDLRERFVEKAAAAARLEIVSEMDALARPSVNPEPSEVILAKVRRGG